MIQIPVVLPLYSGEILVADDIAAQLVIGDGGTLVDLLVARAVVTWSDGERAVCADYVSIWSRTDAVALALKVAARTSLATDDVQSAVAAAYCRRSPTLALVSSGATI